MLKGHWWLRWTLFLAFVVGTSVLASSTLHSKSERFWILFPVWVVVGASLFRLFPRPRLQGAPGIRTGSACGNQAIPPDNAPRKAIDWVLAGRLWTGTILVAAPVVLYLGLAHWAGARASFRELLLAVYFFAISFEFLLLYVFQAFDLLATKLIAWWGARWRWAVKVGTRLVLYTILIPFLVSTFSVHRFKLLPNASDPVVSRMSFENVGFCSRGELPVQLRGWFFRREEAEGTILLCHGVGANRGDLRDIIWLFHEAGFQVLVFDFRGHGESDGHTVTYGHEERNDVLGAYDYLLTRSDVDSHRLFAAGISMGAASLVLALPDMPRVRAAVVDSAYAELDSMVRHQFRWFPDVVVTPLTHITEFFARLETGADVRSVSPIRALDRITIPLFFFHGSDDRIIPVSETQRLFAAYSGPKRLHIEADAPHAGTTILNSAYYQRETKAFFLDSLRPTPISPSSVDGLRTPIVRKKLPIVQ